VSEYPPLDLREQIIRIDRAIAETRKFQAEARKFGRDPWFLLIGAILAAIVTRLPEILKAMGLAQ
jgi:hypothetical protein